ncbi:MAG TPA: hypothetical protein VGM51_18045 [Armatimonadota bacterium]|jgi:hypothetical protein
MTVLKSAVALATFSCMAAAGFRGNAATLDNGLVTARFDARGLVAVTDKASGNTVRFSGDSFALTLDGSVINGASAPLAGGAQTHTGLVFAYNAGGRAVEVVYELQPGWRFVSKQIRIPAVSGITRVNSVQVFAGRLLNPVATERRQRGGSYGSFVRLADEPGAPATRAHCGVFFALQNPFMKWSLSDGAVSMAYEPDMDWKAVYGPFESDRALIGPYRLSGVEFPGMAREWEYIQEPRSFGAGDLKLDATEIQALTDCVDAFVTWRPKETLKFHVGWCENDYQIDVATPEGRTEYKRIIDQAAAVGCRDILFSPANSAVSSLAENKDAWGWENLLWFGLGQKIRKDEWIPGRDPLPPSISELVSYAKAKGVGCVAYVYPSLPWMQDPRWTKWAGDKLGGYLAADTGERGFQDFLVDKLVAFSKATGCAGFSFDHWWIAYDSPATSRYAQWYGCRRIMSELRRRLPDVIIDGRQQYHGFGPWTWVSGSFPHPLASDEQPESFPAFPDMRFDRVSADRERRTFWWYRTANFTPTSIMPGYMTHQTQRYTPDGANPRSAFRRRDWDLLGWRYSVLSSIATAPVNNVVNMLPARDTDEYRLFSADDKAWFKAWLAFTDRNRAILNHTRPIIGQPMVGVVDGTSAMVEDHGFVFLFNPNYRALRGEFTLDRTIGLTAGTRFFIRELEPQSGRLIGKPKTGLWTYGDKVSIPMAGATAIALEIRPVAAGSPSGPMLLNAVGRAVLKGSRLVLTGVRGEIGTRTTLQVILPRGRTFRKALVNGKTLPAATTGGVASIPVRFSGEAFGRCRQVGAYDPDFAGTTYTAKFRVPGRIFRQLNRRKAAWPIAYTADDLEAAWLGAYRLLMFVSIAEPSSKTDVTMKIDGAEVPVKKAYSSVYPQAVDNTFVGFYADLSALKPDREHSVEVTLPPTKSGQFQGLFFENVETEYTGGVARG